MQYLTPRTTVLNIQGETLICASDIVVSKGSTGTVNKTDDIGFVKENNQSNNFSVWDDDWSAEQ